jgi:hypothetical protein
MTIADPITSFAMVSFSCKKRFAAPSGNSLLIELFSKTFTDKQSTNKGAAVPPYF